MPGKTDSLGPSFMIFFEMLVALCGQSLVCIDISHEYSDIITLNLI